VVLSGAGGKPVHQRVTVEDTESMWRVAALKQGTAARMVGMVGDQG